MQGRKGLGRQARVIATAVLVVAVATLVFLAVTVWGGGASGTDGSGSAPAPAEDVAPTAQGFPAGSGSSDAEVSDAGSAGNEATADAEGTADKADAGASADAGAGKAGTGNAGTGNAGTGKAGAGKAGSAPDAEAVAAAKAKLALTERYYQDLQHGPKDAAHQKYIVLHDTEGGGTADGVLSYWEGNGNLIAAHFVVNKDGSILQCVPLDQIAHHAGWGSGNANERFGITEDGRDDLLGRKPSSYYTDYGMNAWSIGIEMVHMGGESYPEAQLEGVDNLIAYIDACYGGNGGTIIDHKMWREGNSDTNPEFADCLANYRDHRTHD